MTETLSRVPVLRHQRFIRFTAGASDTYGDVVVILDLKLHFVSDFDIHSVNVPFDDGTPVCRGSMLTAVRSARAKALKQPSAMWWLLVP